MHYNEIIQELRKDLKISQMKLAEIFQTTQRTVSNWESGRNEPPYEMLIKYAEFFNVSTDYILGLTDDPVPAGRRKSSDKSIGGLRACNEIDAKNKRRILDLTKQIEAILDEDIPSDPK